MNDTKPNPGSDEAIEQGCVCPRIDNHFGKGVPNGDHEPLFWYNATCELHGDTETRATHTKTDQE